MCIRIKNIHAVGMFFWSKQAVFVILMGILLRIFYSLHAYSAIVFDMKAYIDFAQQFLHGTLTSDCCTKNMGYPMFLSILFWFRSNIDIGFVRFAQIFLDVLAGIFTWIGARRIFSKKTADIALVIYMLNPFTSSYVGLILPEAYSCFVVALLIAVCTNASFRQKGISWFLFGFLLGLLLFLRFSVLSFVFGSIIIVSLLSFTKRERWKFLFISLSGLLLISSYTLFVNFRNYGRISLIPPYAMGGGAMYLMFYADRYPEVEYWGINPEVSRVFEEYNQTPQAKRTEWNTHYTQLFYSKLLHEPAVFLVHYVKNIFWLWDKDHLFVYADPWYPTDRYFLRIVNIGVIFLSLWGLFRYMKKGFQRLGEPLVIITVNLLGVLSLLFPLVSNESRHTILFYPLLILWCSYGLSIALRYEEK